MLFLATMKTLFVCGIPRGGTTGLAQHLNEHPEILIGIERYKGVNAGQITPGHFAKARLLDFRPGETRHEERNRHLVDAKDFERLAWVGDKRPRYALHLDALHRNVPSARFVAIYRPLQGVAVSFEARKANPADDWDIGYREAVEWFNLTLRRLRHFAKRVPEASLLLLDYRAFYSDPASHAPALGQFLGVPFGEEVLEGWRRISEERTELLSERAPRDRLTDDQQAYLAEHKDRRLERWAIRRAEEQRS